MHHASKKTKQTDQSEINNSLFTLLPRCQIGENKNGSKIKPYSVVTVGAAWRMEQTQELSQERDTCSFLFVIKEYFSGMLPGCAAKGAAGYTAIPCHWPVILLPHLSLSPISPCSVFTLGALEAHDSLPSWILIYFHERYS